MFRRRLLHLVALRFLAFVVAALAASGSRAAEALAQQTIDSRAAMERLKTLAGEWESTLKGGSGQPQRFNYTMTGRGTVLIENGGGMMTAYHLDKDQLVLTHFCGAGNQPRMRIKAADSQHIFFEIYDITNLASPDAYRSTSLDVVWLSADRVDLIYGGMTDGVPSSQTFQLLRKETR